MQLRVNLCCQFIINKGQDCCLQMKHLKNDFSNFFICFAMKMPVYKLENNKLVRIFWLKNELFQSRGIWACSKCP